MRGSIIQRYKGSWSLVIDLGYQRDQATGKTKRKQKWITFRGTRKAAETELTKILGQLDTGQYVDASKITLGQWLAEWLTTITPRLRPSTRTRYAGIISQHLQPSTLGAMLLQKIRPTHVEQYYAAATVSASTLTLHHTILQQAFRKALRDRLIAINPLADRLDGRPRRDRATKHEDARQHAWSAPEARAFLQAAREAGPQPAAFYALALDSGMRRGELAGLLWADVDLDAGTIRIVRTLLSPTPKPDGSLQVGPTKTGKPRTVRIGAETVALLRAHRKAQRELLMANRATYKDHGLVFAKTDSTSGEHLGDPLQVNTIGAREFGGLIRAAGIRRIKFHGLRHTCATLLLQAGQPVHVVAERLGHAQVSMTLEVYAHVLPDMQQDAAAKLGALLHG